MKCTSWSPEGRWECNGDVIYKDKYIFGSDLSLADCRDSCLELNEENGCCSYDFTDFCSWIPNSTAVLTTTSIGTTNRAFTCSDEGRF